MLEEDSSKRTEIDQSYKWQQDSACTFDVDSSIRPKINLDKYYSAKGITRPISTISVNTCLKNRAKPSFTYLEPKKFAFTNVSASRKLRSRLQIGIDEAEVTSNASSTHLSHFAAFKLNAGLSVANAQKAISVKSAEPTKPEKSRPTKFFTFGKQNTNPANLSLNNDRECDGSDLPSNRLRNITSIEPKSMRMLRSQSRHSQDTSLPQMTSPTSSLIISSLQEQLPPVRSSKGKRISLAIRLLRKPQTRPHV